VTKPAMLPRPRQSLKDDMYTLKTNK